MLLNWIALSTHTMRCIPSMEIHNKHIYDAKYLHLHIRRLALFEQYTNIDGYISLEVFNNKLLWLMALNMLHSGTRSTTMTPMCAMKCINWFWLFMASTIFDLQNLFISLALSLRFPICCSKQSFWSFETMLWIGNFIWLSVSFVHILCVVLCFSVCV